MSSVVVRPAACVRGRVTIPGDKSISHRYALLAALADGTTTITRYAPGADCASTLSCLAALGVTVSGPTGAPDAHPDQRVVTVQGRGLGGLRASQSPLDAGNSGTTLRLLSGILAGHNFESILTGDASLRGRPMRRVIDPLSRMGATVRGDDDRPPLSVRGAALHGISYTAPVASAQVKSAVLLAGLHAAGETTVTEPQPTRDHTERALPLFGVDLIRANGAIRLRGGQRLRATKVRVPGDASSAACWAVAAAALAGSDVTLEDVGLNPTRFGFLSVLKRAGARIDVADGPAVGDEPIGALRIRHAGLTPVEIGPAEVPGTIDELPLLAALATHRGAITVTGAGELRRPDLRAGPGVAGTWRPC